MGLTVNLTDALSELNLFIAEARVLELLEAWRAGDNARVAEIREELLGAYGYCGLTDAYISKMLFRLTRKGL